MQPITIREASFDDIDSLSAILGQGVRYHQSILPDYFQDTDSPQTLEDLRADIKEDSSGYFLALTGDSVVGVLDLKEIHQPKSPVFIPYSYALIKRLVVHEEFREQKVGSLLVEHAKKWAKERKLSGVRLHVWKGNNAAVSFYEKNGFCTLSQMMSFDV